MKRIIVYILMITALLFSLCSCSKEETVTTSENATVYTQSSEMPQTTANVSVPSIVVESITAKVGEQVEVAVKVVNNPGIAGALIQLNFDERLSLVDEEKGAAFSELDYTKPGKLENACRFSWDSESGMAKNDGEILILTFDVPDGLTVGDTLNVSCTYKNGDIYDESLNDVSLECEDGTITII